MHARILAGRLAHFTTLFAAWRPGIASPTISPSLANIYQLGVAFRLLLDFFWLPFARRDFAYPRTRAGSSQHIPTIQHAFSASNSVRRRPFLTLCQLQPAATPRASAISRFSSPARLFLCNSLHIVRAAQPVCCRCAYIAATRRYSRALQLFNSLHYIERSRGRLRLLCCLKTRL